MSNFKLEDVHEILLNLAGGLQPEDLSEQEVHILSSYYGEGWKRHLGYELDS